MHVKSIVSALALSAAFALSGPASAQTMFNGAALSEEDLAAVTQRCEQLNTASGESLTENSEDNDESSESDGSQADSSDDNAGSADATLESVEEVNEAAAATTTSIDLDTITLEMCTEAGLPAPAM